MKACRPFGTPFIAAAYRGLTPPANSCRPFGTPLVAAAVPKARRRIAGGGASQILQSVSEGGLASETSGK